MTDPPHDPARPRRWTQPLLVVAVFAAAGMLCGALWEWVWNPPSGVAYLGEFVLDAQGLPADFGGTGWYALIALLAAIPLGFVLAVACDRDAVVTLVAIAVGSALAAWLMWWVGIELGPPDPDAVARTTGDFEPVTGDLQVRGWGAYLLWPAGAMGGAAAGWLSGLRIR